MLELAPNHPIQIEIAKLEASDSHKIELSHATSLVISDKLPGAVDAVYFFGRAFGDAKKGEIYPEVAQLYREGLARRVAIYGNEGRRVNGTVPEEAGPSYVRVVNRLQRMGVQPEDILITPDDPRHTKAEGDALLKLADSEQWRTIAIASHPHQALRAMLGIVRTLDNTGQKIDVYTIVPQTTDWERRVFGSQGMQRKTRREHITDELVRVQLYQEKGDLASFQELYDYMNNRGQLTPQPPVQG